MKRIMFIFLIMAIAGLNALTFDEVKNSPQYLYGYAKSSSYEKANNIALNELISQISVNVQSSYSNVVLEDGQSLKEVSELIVKTYSSTSLNNVEKIEEELADGSIQVMRYINKDEINNIFINRRNLVFDLMEDALKAEKDVRIGDALKYYYWSLMLLKTIPDSDKIEKTIPDESVKRLDLLIPRRIENLINHIKLVKKSINQDNDSKIASIEFTASYEGQLIDSFIYKYRTGSYWSQNIKLNDGLGLIETDKENMSVIKQIPIIIEYKNFEQSRCIDAVYQVLNSITLVSFNTQVFLSMNEEVPVQKETLQTDATTNTQTVSSVNSPKEKEGNSTQLDGNQAQQLLKSIESICSAVSKKNFDSIRPLFTENGYNQFVKTVQYGNARLMQNPSSNITFTENNDRVVARSVPMCLKFKNSSSQIIEKVYFTFDQSRLIDEVGFCLSQRTNSDIMNRPDRWGTTAAKLSLLEFMERYKTAYCLKDIDFINNVFSENALIIIGRVLKENPNPEQKYNFGPKIQYKRYSKVEYVNNLKRAFNSNEFIHVQFEETDIKRAESEPIYGIQLKQLYSSSSYRDKGYLFLMIDLKNEKEPKIYVRSWQPQKNPDGTILGLDDFKF